MNRSVFSVKTPVLFYVIVAMFPVIFALPVNSIPADVYANVYSGGLCVAVYLSNTEALTMFKSVIIT